MQIQEEQLPEPKRSIPQQIVDGLPEVPAVVTTHQSRLWLLLPRCRLLLADLLLKLIKPAIKKIVAKIKALGVRFRSLFLNDVPQRDRTRGYSASSLGR